MALSVLLALCAEQGLCNGRVSVSKNPSVCPIHPLQQRAAGLLLWARRVGDIDRLLHGQHHSSMEPQHGAQQQMRVVPCSCRKLDTDLFVLVESPVRVEKSVGPHVNHGKCD